MASSFIEDILGSEVDEKAVSAVVGSLESQLASSSGNKPTNVGKVKTLPHLQRSSQVPLASSSLASNASQSNNSPISMGTNTSNTTASQINPGKTSYHTNSTSGSVSTPVNIAPRPIVTTTVSLAPRTVTLVSPRSGNRGSYLPVQTGGIRLQSLMMGGNQLPLTSRMVAGQMSRPTATTPQNIVHNHPTQTVSIHQTGSAQRITGKLQQKQEPGLSQPQVTLLNNNLHSSPQTTVHIAQNHTNISMKKSGVPQSNAVNHISSSMLTKTVPTAAVVTTSSSAKASMNSAAVAQAQLKHVEKIKQVTKLQGFFTKLVDLATAQSPAIGNNVRELIKAVMERKLTEEDFTAKLEKTLHSPSQPNLVNFLKQTLPFLQSVQKANAAAAASSSVAQQVHHVQKPIQSIAAVTKAQPTILPSTQVPQQVPQVIPKPHMKPTTTTQQIVITPQTLAQLTPQQRQQLLAQHPRLQQLFPKMQLPSSKSGVVLVSTQGTHRQGATLSGSIKPAPAPSTAQAQDKSKARPTSSISAVTSGNDDDINDVACMAGVNLQEEQSKILATNSEILNLQLRSCKDSYFLNNKLLQKQIEEIASKHGVNSISPSICGLVSHATQERLMNIIEKLSIFSLHRLETMKDDPTYQPSSDVKSQLRVFEQIDEIERRKREAREREVLIRAAKSRSRQEDPEQARLKEKAKQLQLEEEETLRKRAANKTALDAIGPRKKRKLDEINATEGSTITNKHTPTTNSSRNQFLRQRTRHVVLKDLLLIMEQEKELCHSKLLYKALMK